MRMRPVLCSSTARMMYILAPVASPFDEVRGQRASD
jgi:hypothetical protein